MPISKMTSEEKARLSPSSRFSLRFMHNTNKLAIFIFLAGILFYIVKRLLR